MENNFFKSVENFNGRWPIRASPLIKQFVLYAGQLIASPLMNSGYKKKIGTGTEISELWPDATANLNSSSNNVLIETGSKLESHGGTLIASSGSLLGW